MLKLLDLFSGIGGFSLGLERTGGFETVAFCEIDNFCQKVLRKHWPNVRQYTDIKTLTAAQLKADGITVDVICGGFPCQDISLAGEGAGMGEGTRSGLWSEYARLIGELRPKYAIVENVSALLGRGLDRVLGDLAQIGYDAEWHCIPASAVGAPHRRDRIWIVAHPVCGGCGERCVWNKRGNGCEIGEGWATQLEQSSEAPTPLAHTHIARLQIINETRDSRQTASRIIAGGELEQAYSKSGAKQWRVEPNVGGIIDGFSIWLDGLELTEPHNLLMAYVNAENARPNKTLRTLRDRIYPQDSERETTGSICISPQTVLFSFLCQLEKRATDETRIQLESEKTSGEELRGLRPRQKPSRTPHRSEAIEQCGAEHSDALQSLSQLLALHAEKAWVAYRRENATALLGWESGIARTAHGVPAKVDRLKSLGNAVVPQIPELIGRAILSAEAASPQEE